MARPTILILMAAIAAMAAMPAQAAPDKEGASDTGSTQATDTNIGSGTGAADSATVAVDQRKSAEVFAGADLDEGRSLIAQHDCEACHTRNVGGDGSSIYRPAGRINSPGFLRGMVEYCNTQLNLQLFPEEVTSIGAMLNRQHYRFD